MDPKFTYSWHIHQFEDAKNNAERFILSVDETQFLQPPAEGRWSIAECYSHLINFGELYYNNLAAGIANTQETTNELGQTFRPGWLVRQITTFFEPPYKIKMQTFDNMKPSPVSGYTRMELLDEYLNLQDRFIAQLKKGQKHRINLRSAKMKHPTWSFLKISLSGGFALTGAHQRRHQWQAEQTLKALEQAL